MMSRLAFWMVMMVVYPLSALPFSILYRIADILFFPISRYRRKTVSLNLRNAFPEKAGSAELKSIEKKFYRNLSDLIVENVKMVSISKEEVMERCYFRNIEVFDNYYRQGKSVIVTIGHCGNWEMAGLVTGLAAKHHCIVFYRKLKNPHFDRFVKKMRAKFGIELLPHTSVRQMLQQEGKQPNLYVFITDQTPSNPRTCHWMRFLNQDTAIYRGAEKTALLTGHPVVYADVQRVKRGYYAIDLILLAENPAETQEGEITELHTRALEKSIMKNPDNWLWTHRRWKRKKPSELTITAANAQ